MNSASERIQLLIDVFDKTEQIAQPLDTLQTEKLISGILEEFHEDLEFLGNDPKHYRLINVNDKKELKGDQSISTQVRPNDHLQLTEIERSAPVGTQKSAQHLYLKIERTRDVHKLYWLPAYIGRPAAELDDDQPLAIDLDSYPTGQKVSRRHVVIEQVDEGNCVVRNLALDPNNPVSVRSKDGNVITLESDAHLLEHYDCIILERSEIILRYLER